MPYGQEDLDAVQGPLDQPLPTQQFDPNRRVHKSTGAGPNKALPVDTEWVSNAFMIPNLEIKNPYHRQNRYSSPADLSFVTHGPGGAIGINARPGNTPYADILRPGRILDRDQTPFSVNKIATNQYGFGVGRHWFEKEYEPAQKVFMRFGVPEHNSMVNFLRRAFTYPEIVMARRGRAPSFLYTIASGVTKFFFARAFPVVTMGYLIFRSMSFLLGRPNNRYVSLKPTMHLYWNAVNTLVNTWMVNRGIMPKSMKRLAGADNNQIMGRPFQIDSEYVEVFHQFFPEFFVKVKVGDSDASVYVDVFAIANRAQRIANRLFLYELQRYDKDDAEPRSIDELQGYLQKRTGTSQDNFLRNSLTAEGEMTLSAFISTYINIPYWFSPKIKPSDQQGAEYDPRLESENGSTTPTPQEVQAQGFNSASDTSVDPSTISETATQGDSSGAAPTENTEALTPAAQKLYDAHQASLAASESGDSSALDENFPGSDKTYMDGQHRATPDGFKDNPKASHLEQYAQALEAEFRNGASFVCFHMDYTGGTQFSLSNTYGETELSSRLNSLSSKAKEFRFAVGDGNVLGGPINGFLNAVGDVIGGVAESATLGASNLLLGLAGSGYLDLPKHWVNSTSDMPRASYSATFISPSQDPFSQLIHIYMPLFALIAAATARSTGRSSYTGPFVGQLFDRGKAQSQYGAIESLSVRLGASNLGYSMDGKALAVEVSWNWVDLSSIFHMPISSGNVLEGYSGFGLDDDNVISDLLAVLAGQDMYSQIHALPRAFRRLAKASAALGKYTSPHWMASFTHDKLTNGGGLFALTRPFARLYEFSQAGAAATGSRDGLGATASN